MGAADTAASAVAAGVSAATVGWGDAGVTTLLLVVSETGTATLDAALLLHPAINRPAAMPADADAIRPGCGFFTMPSFDWIDRYARCGWMGPKPGVDVRSGDQEG
ncbi:MAG: hypothetical protein ABI468_02115 [Candidatus Nanopelagicales bacterium]